MRTFTVQSNDGEAKLLLQMFVLRRVASFAKKEMKRRIKKYQYLNSRCGAAIVVLTANIINEKEYVQ